MHAISGTNLAAVADYESGPGLAINIGAVMAIIMLTNMWKMYDGAGAKLTVIAISAIIFWGLLWLVRSLATVDDVSWMSAMIPHHSIAVLTSRRAHIRDPRVRELADGIIEAQVREIAKMKRLIADLQANQIEAGTPDLEPVAAR